MFKYIASAIILLGTAATTLPAHAKNVCNTREHFVKKLTEDLGEVSRAIGVQNDKQIVEFWSSEKTGNWTMLVTQANGRSCIVAVGSKWIENPAYLTAFDEKVSFETK